MTIHADDDYERTLRRLVRHWTRRVRRLAKDALCGEVDAVHDMRTGVRRLRTLLGLARGSRARRLRKRGKRLGIALGTVRDLDVALGHVRMSVERGELFLEDGVRAWLVALERERAEALHRLRRALRRDFPTWRQDTLAWTKGGKPGPLVHEALPPALTALLDRCEALAPPPDETALHELRKAVKRLRYALEFFEDALPLDSKAVAESLTDVQDALGDHRDHLGLAERAIHEADACTAMGEDPRELRAYARRLEEGSQGEVIEAACVALEGARESIALPRSG